MDPTLHPNMIKPSNGWFIILFPGFRPERCLHRGTDPHFDRAGGGLQRARSAKRLGPDAKFPQEIPSGASNMAGKSMKVKKILVSAKAATGHVQQVWIRRSGDPVIQLNGMNISQSKKEVHLWFQHESSFNNQCWLVVSTPLKNISQLR